MVFGEQPHSMIWGESKSLIGGVPLFIVTDGVPQPVNLLYYVPFEIIDGTYKGVFVTISNIIFYQL